MKVLFDHQIYNNQNFGGISRYFYELSKGLIELDVTVQNSVFFSENEFCADRQLYKSRPFPNVTFKGSKRLKRYINTARSKRLLRKEDFDVFHPTYYDTYFLDKSVLKKPFVLTFHDLIHEKFSEKYPSLLPKATQEIEKRRQLLQQAAVIIAVSQNTKNDIIDYYSVREEKIKVVHLAGDILTTDVIPTNKTADRYILFIGKRAGYKNWENFIEAIVPLLLADKGLRVKCGGGGRFDDDEKNFLHKLGILDQVQYEEVSNQSLGCLYQNAICFVFPSQYEGFGIPALESFSCGCPTILSNASSLPEVGGDGATYIDPYDKQDILEKVGTVVYDLELQDLLRRKGYQRAQQFSWLQTATNTLAIYKDIV